MSPCYSFRDYRQITFVMLKQKPPPPVLTRQYRTPTKIKWRIHNLFTLYFRFWRYLFIYLVIYLFIYSLFKVDKFTIETDIILHTNKNRYVLIINIKTCLFTSTLYNKTFWNLNFKICNKKKNQNVKNYWLKENNNSSNFTKLYIFDKNLANSAWTVFSPPFFNSLFEVI